MLRRSITNVFRSLTAKPKCLETDDVSHPDPRLIIVLLAVGMLVGAAFTSNNAGSVSTSVAQEKSAALYAADVSR